MARAPDTRHATRADLARGGEDERQREKPKCGQATRGGQDVPTARPHGILFQARPVAGATRANRALVVEPPPDHISHLPFGQLSAGRGYTSGRAYRQRAEAQRPRRPRFRQYGGLTPRGSRGTRRLRRLDAGRFARCARQSVRLALPDPPRQDAEVRGVGRVCSRSGKATGPQWTTCLAACERAAVSGRGWRPPRRATAM